MAHLVSVEAVNFAAIGMDTSDLSTMRGGGLMLLDAITALDDPPTVKGGIRHRLEELHAREAFADFGVTTLTTGASSGVWRIDAPREVIEVLVADLRAGLRNGTAFPDKPILCAALRHATFVVVAISEAGPNSVEAPGEDGGYLADRERLTAAVRWAQMSTPNEVYPDVPTHRRAGEKLRHGEGNAANVCSIDLKRPAMPDRLRVGGREISVSQSVADRRAHGLAAKQGFYDREAAAGDRAGKKLSLPAEITRYSRAFATQFSSISEPRVGGPLADKIAVLHFDGNKFSDVQRRFVLGEIVDDRKEDLSDARQRAQLRQVDFDRLMKGMRREFLIDLVRLLAQSPGGSGEPSREEVEERSRWEPEHRGHPVVRLETLMWGGDECCFVMPAHLGFAVTRLLFDHVDGRGRTPWTIGATQLGVAAGMVFCHHDAPIARIRTLAEKLVNLVKKRNQLASPDRRTANGLACLVLESQDHLGRDLEDHLALFWSPLKADTTASVLDVTVPELLRDLKHSLEVAGFARRRLRSLATDLHAGREFNRPEEWSDDSDVWKHLKELAALGVNGARAIVFMEMFWDYLDATPAEKETAR